MCAGLFFGGRGTPFFMCDGLFMGGVGTLLFVFAGMPFDAAGFAAEEAGRGFACGLLLPLRPCMPTASLSLLTLTFAPADLS